jgi:hypothetical protein
MRFESSVNLPSSFTAGKGVGELGTGEINLFFPRRHASLSDKDY